MNVAGIVAGRVASSDAREPAQGSAAPGAFDAVLAGIGGEGEPAAGTPDARGEAAPEAAPAEAGRAVRHRHQHHARLQGDGEGGGRERDSNDRPATVGDAPVMPLVAAGAVPVSQRGPVVTETMIGAPPPDAGPAAVPEASSPLDEPASPNLAEAVDPQHAPPRVQAVEARPPRAEFARARADAVAATAAIEKAEPAPVKHTNAVQAPVHASVLAHAAAIARADASIPLSLKAGEVAPPTLARDAKPTTAKPSLTVLGQRTHFAPVVAPAIDGSRADDANDADQGSPQRGPFANGARTVPPRTPKAAAVEAEPLARINTDGIASASIAGLPGTDPGVRALADAITTAIADTAPADAPSPVSPQPLPTRAQPVRDIALSLDLAGLGGVTLRLTVSGQSLSLRVSAERAETVHALHRDRAALEHILERAGYDADIVTIGPRLPDGLASAPTATTSFDAGVASGGASERQSEDRPRGRSSPSDDGAPRGEAAGGSDRGSRGLYV